MDAISGALEGACGLADLVCNAAGLNDFDLAMNNQAALIESEASLARGAINAQTSLMQSEAAANRVNNAILYSSIGYGEDGGYSEKERKASTIGAVVCVSVYVISMLVLTVALI